MAKKRKSYPLRIDPEVHAALERWAADDLRSVNAQIEFLLRQAVLQAGRLRPMSPMSADSGGQDDPERVSEKPD